MFFCFVFLGVLSLVCLLMWSGELNVDSWDGNAVSVPWLEDSESGRCPWCVCVSFVVYFLRYFCSS